MMGIMITVNFSSRRAAALMRVVRPGAAQTVTDQSICIGDFSTLSFSHEIAKNLLRTS
jgi:hypothetical protein